MNPTSLVLRPFERGDTDAVRALNAANVPAVGELDDERLAFFTTDAVFRVAAVEGQLVGMFVGLPHGTPYWSPNYRWFADRYPAFAYVDRVAVATGARQLGVGRAFYDEFEAWARHHTIDLLCAEVNEEPPNPVSMRFHAALGFDVVASTHPYGDEQRVAMVVKRLERLRSRPHQRR